MNPKLSQGSARSRAAFTLIELLVVIAIIAILAGLLLQTAGYVQEKSSRSLAEGQIKALGLALEDYKLEYGTYPEAANGSEDSSTKVLIQELAVAPMNENRKGFEFPAKMLSDYRASVPKDYRSLLQGSNYLVDPFGNPYHYQFPGNDDRNGKNSYDLWSQGKKNSGNEKLWVKNW